MRKLMLIVMLSACNTTPAPEKKVDYTPVKKLAEIAAPIFKDTATTTECISEAVKLIRKNNVCLDLDIDPSISVNWCGDAAAEKLELFKQINQAKNCDQLAYVQRFVMKAIHNAEVNAAFGK